MKGGGLGPERMTHEELFLGDQDERCVRLDPDPTPLRENTTATRDISARERAGIDQHSGADRDLPEHRRAPVELYEPQDSSGRYLSRDPAPADDHRFSHGDFNAGRRFPTSASCSIKYKKKLRKMQAAQKDSKGNLRVDVTAQVATQELIQIQQEIIAKSVKTAKVSVVIGVRTSAPAWTSDEYEKAERELGRAAGNKFSRCWRT